jgi:hypothetical protein
MRGHTVVTEDGLIEVMLPTTTGGGFSGRFTVDQAEELAHNLLLRAYEALGNTPGEQQFRQVRAWRLR